jgi:hypothetical protein
MAKRASRPDYSNNFFKEIRINSLKDFYKRAHMEYQDFRNYFKLDLTHKDLEK